MSAGGIGVLYPSGREELEPKEKHALLKLYERYTPSQGWSTFVLLSLALLVVGQSVTSAGWARTPTLLGVMFWGAIAGLLLAKVRVPAVLLHLVALVLGFVVVVWKTSSIIEDEPLFTQARMLWERLSIWYEAATTGGISTDLIPVSLTLIAAGWLISYVSSWFIFRSDNVWIGVVLMGTAILTNLSFLPQSFAASFFVFAFLAILLVVRLSIVHRQQTWSREGIEFSPISGWLTINSAIWFGIVVLVLASFLPMYVFVSPTLATMWRTARSPVAHLEDEFARLFSSIPSQKDLPGRLFGKTLPFMGAISFGGEAVFWANTNYPSYWLSQTYSEYTPQGWVAGETQTIDIGPQIVPPPRADMTKREPVEQNLQLSFETSNFLSGGGLDWVSHNAVIETLAPKRFTINLLDSSEDAELPEDIQELAVSLREGLESREEDDVLESFISRNLPRDMVLEEVAYREATDEEERALEFATLLRKEPVAPEIVSWKFADPLPTNEAYTMVSYVSLATDDELREAGTDYNSFITDHYLTLPPDLPQRVRDLSERLTENAETPLDKALIIQSFLRSDRFEYSQNIEAPPARADGVDYFLFETQKGYSDYFGSAMAVMLRAVGVPARMAAGYGPGMYDDESGLHIVRDLDSHGWVQVYFPEYGWIDFEPTPSWPKHERRLITDPTAGLLDGDIGADDAIDESLEDLFDEALEEFGVPPIDREGRGGLPIDVVGLLIRAGIALGVGGVVWLVMWWAWTRNLKNASPVERAYSKMSRLGTLAGVRRGTMQTPLDYARSMGIVLPTIAPGANQIAWAFALNRYGNRAMADEEVEEIDQAWKSMRRSLLARAALRLAPLRRRRRS